MPWLHLRVPQKPTQLDQLSFLVKFSKIILNSCKYLLNSVSYLLINTFNPRIHFRQKIVRVPPVAALQSRLLPGDVDDAELVVAHAADRR